MSALCLLQIEGATMTNLNSDLKIKAAECATEIVKELAKTLSNPDTLAAAYRTIYKAVKEELFS